MGRLSLQDNTSAAYERSFQFGPTSAFSISINNLDLLQADCAHSPWLPRTCSSLISAARCRLRQSHYFDARRESLGPINVLRRLLIVGLFRFENVGNKPPRIAVIQWEPRALHLDHDAVALLKNVICGVQINGERRYFPRFERLRLFE